MNNNTPDLVALASEVLDDELAWAALDPGHHPEGQAAVYRLAAVAPDLARAVIATRALADQLREAANESYQENMDDVGDAYQAAANLIHAALNGENRD